jgi:hypothetical protein
MPVTTHTLFKEISAAAVRVDDSLSLSPPLALPSQQKQDNAESWCACKPFVSSHSTANPRPSRSPSTQISHAGPRWGALDGGGVAGRTLSNGVGGTTPSFPCPPLCLPLPRAAVATSSLYMGAQWRRPGGGSGGPASSHPPPAAGRGGAGGRGRLLVASPPRGPGWQPFTRRGQPRCGCTGCGGGGALRSAVAAWTETAPSHPPHIPASPSSGSFMPPPAREESGLPALPLPLNLGRHAAHLNSARRRGYGSA